LPASPSRNVEFICKVADSSGRVFQQLEAAQSVAEARQKLADRGLFVYSVEARGGVVGEVLRRRRDRALRGTDFLVFNQQFNTLIKAGLPILKALDLLAERAAALRLRPLIREVRQQVQEGALLSEAFEAQGVFPRVYVTSVLAGEKSGNLSGVLDQYIAYQKVATSFRRRLIGSLIYPGILVFVAVLIVTLLSIYVIPRFADLFKELNVPLPVQTQFVVTLAVSLRPYLIAGAGLLTVAAVFAVFWSRTETGGMFLDRLKLRLPVAGSTWVQFQTAQFSRTLATLLAGGTPLVSALETAAGAASSRLVSSAIRQAGATVREGRSLHDSLAATGLLPALALDMIQVGEGTGALAPMLNSIAEFYEEEVNLHLSAMVNVIEPSILVFVALFVGSILYALYSPIFQFTVGGIAR